MALLLKNSIFYHIPKTGGRWVGSVLRDMGLVKREYLQPGIRWPLNLVEEHVSPARAKKNVVKDLFSFAFVRNPITWYQSFWKYKNNSTWDEPYVKYGSSDFNEFMTKIMLITPGFLTQMYREFDKVSYMGRLENLRSDLRAILDSLGENYSDSLIFEAPSLGASSTKVNIEYDPKILKKMKKLERWIFKKYYPESI